MAFKGLRESSPVGIPQMFLLAFVDLAALGEIPRRTGDRFLGKADKRPVTVCELMARAGESGEDPVVVYVSHRWLEPDFKNPDDHSKARFYQVRDGGRDREWFGLVQFDFRFGSMLVGYYCCLCVCLCVCLSVCVFARLPVGVILLHKQGSSYFSLREAVPPTSRSHSGSMDVLDVIAAPRL